MIPETSHLALYINIKTDTMDGFTEWLDDWLNDFLIEDYDGIAITPLSYIMFIPMNQIKPDRLDIVGECPAASEESVYSNSFFYSLWHGTPHHGRDRLYPDTTNGEHFKIFQVFQCDLED